ncbi:Aste57867_22341 [Aphanomyces stellatus]|uniref:Aste57867_22341 protein n=1 Tax=Aphanomyces stellatus TaxID=120398 RepID=A0A485LK36_9STRA|nr:hypothetical protein As57867_022271 [Aphanomyces stellatus]VFT99004.1 Aste57867_22341 [Aphanomyces stellatus]
MSTQENNHTEIGLDQPYIETGGKAATNARPVNHASLRVLGLKVNALGGCFVFAFLQLIALWVLTFVYHIPVNSVQLGGSAFGGNSGGSLKQKVVSFDLNGNLRAGAGTTAYLDAATPPSTTMEYIQVARMGVSQPSYTTSILSYYVRSASQTIVTTVTTNTADKTISVATTDPANVLSNQVRGIATLSDSVSVLLEQSSSGGVFVTPAKTTATSVSLEPAQRTAVATGSYSNLIGAISSTQFAVTYFDAYNSSGPWYQHVVAGSVGTDGTITMLPTKLTFGDANSYDTVTFASQSVTVGKPQGLSAFPGTFVQPWWTDKPVATNAGLCLVTAQVNATAVTKLTEACNPKYRPAYFVDSTAFSPTTFVLAFYDANNNHAFTLVLVEVSLTKVFFRSAYVLSANGNFNYGSFYSWYPTPSVTLVSPTRVAVAFLNGNSQGRAYVQTFTLTDAGTFKPLTALLRVGDASLTGPGDVTHPTSGSVTLGIVPVSAESIVVAVGGSLGSVTPKRLSLVEFYGPVAGIGAGSSGVVVNGAAKVGAAVTAGATYYTTTRGDVVSVTQTDPSADSFAVGSTLVVSADSRIGVAVDDASIYVPGH